MNLIQLPIPSEYVYIDTDKIISMEFDAVTGALTIALLGEVNRVFYTNSKKILDAILIATHCKDGLPKIPKKERPEPTIVPAAETDYYEVCPI